MNPSRLPGCVKKTIELGRAWCPVGPCFSEPHSVSSSGNRVLGTQRKNPRHLAGDQAFCASVHSSKHKPDGTSPSEALSGIPRWEMPRVFVHNLAGEKGN